MNVIVRYRSRADKSKSSVQTFVELRARKANLAVRPSMVVSDPFMTGSVGIFWGIPDSNRSWTLLTDATPLAEAEPYGDFLTHPRGHYDVWNNWQKLNAAALARQSIPQVVAYHEYEDFPRGRIVYQIKSGQFIVYADRRLQLPDLLTEIANLFALVPGTFVVRSDAHYRT